MHHFYLSCLKCKLDLTEIYSQYPVGVQFVYILCTHSGTSLKAYDVKVKIMIIKQIVFNGVTKIVLDSFYSYILNESYISFKWQIGIIRILYLIPKKVKQNANTQIFSDNNL